MALLQETSAAQTLDTKEAHHETLESKFPGSANIEGQDEQLWEKAITNSLDVIREMANKARAERRAGRTKKINL